MKNCFIGILFFFTMCNAKPGPEKKFEGSYSGNHQGIRSAADLRVQGKQLEGEVMLNDKLARISGTINGLVVTGVLKDDETGQLYNYTGNLSGAELRLRCTSPEDNSQTVELVMHKNEQAPVSASTSSPQSSAPGSSAREHDADLVGVWKSTEVLGSGEYSFSTEYFMELKEDGTLVSWTGQSAGSGFSAGSDEANASTGEWYTEGNKLFFVDPATRKDDHTLYSVSESGLLLHNGGSEKKIFQRVR